MSMPHTGGTGLFWIIAGLLLLVKKHSTLVLAGLISLILFTQLRGSTIGSHWDQIGNDDGWVFRGASEQRFPLPFGSNERTEWSIIIGEEHVLGSDPQRFWNRKFEPGFGLAMIYDFSQSWIEGTVRIGGELSYGFRPDTSLLNLTPYLDLWLRWGQGSFPGTSWFTFRKEGFGDGPVGRFFAEQGVQLFSRNALKLAPGIICQGVYGLKPYPWNRKLEAGPGLRTDVGPVTARLYYLWSKRPDLATSSLQFQVSWWFDWNLSR